MRLDRLRQRRMDRSLHRQRHLQRRAHGGPGGRRLRPQFPVPQPWGRHLLPGDRQCRSRRDRLGQRRGSGRLRQRRVDRPVRHQLRPRSSVPEQRQRNLYRSGSLRGSRRRRGMEHGSRVRRLRRRRVAGPLRGALSGVRRRRPSTGRRVLRIPGYPGHVRSQRADGSARRPLPQQRRRYLHRCDSGDRGAG